MLKNVLQIKLVNILKTAVLLSLILSLSFLVACQDDAGSVKESGAFSFESPDKNLASEPKKSVEQESATAEEKETPEAKLPSSQEKKEGEQSGSQKQSEQKTQASTVKTAIPTGDEKVLRDENVPIYALLANADVNEEPPVPIHVPKKDSLRGISGSKVERFFKTLSVNPVTYHYLLLPSENMPNSANNEGAVEVYIALYNDSSYMRVATEDKNVAFLQLSENSYYEMDFSSDTYQIIPGSITDSNQLSMRAFRALEDNASGFIPTGKGSAVFFGRRVDFEEFTADGELYVRYYFIGDVVVGHRSFKNGKIVRTVRVYESSNKYDEGLYHIPEGMKQIDGNAETNVAEKEKEPRTASTTTDKTP